MIEPNTTDEYDQIVNKLVEEFQEEIEDGAARSIANHMVAAFEIVDGKPTVLDAVEYEGAPVESIDECLNPYSVLQQSNPEPLPDRRDGYRDQAAGRAAEALTVDMLEAFREQNRRTKQKA